MKKMDKVLIEEGIKDYAITRIKEIADCKDEVYGHDLHHELFNTDYYIVGTYQAKEWLNSYGVFDAIEKVMEYENDHFGEIYTEIHDPEKMANMLAYIIGEEILQESDTLQDSWDDILSCNKLKKIIKELK